MSTAKRKTGRRSLGERRQFAIRIDPDVVDDFDKIAQEYGLSRTQLIGRIMKNMVQERERLEGDLLKGWSESLDVVLERVLREVIRGEAGPVLPTPAVREKVKRAKGGKR